MIEPVSGTKYPKLFRSVLRAVVGDQPFRNATFVEDSLQMIDDSARAGVCQCSYDRKLVVVVTN